MIRSSKHSLKFTNKNKLVTYSLFLCEYRRVACLIINDIWDNGYKSFDITNNQLDFPKYIDYKDFKTETSLSARALSSLVTQLSSIIRGAVAENKKTVYTNEKHNKSKQLKKVSKPNLSKINPELSSKCVDFKKGISFDYFIRLKSTGFNHIKIPIKATKVSNKWNSQGRMLSSILLSDNHLELRFEIENKLIKDTGVIVGADTGIKTVVTFSDNSTANKIDNHLHTLDSITKELSKKKKGSKAFKRKQQHRKNHINWFINQIDFSNLKQINLEEITNIGYKKSRSRYLSHFTNTLIRDKIKRKAEEQEVLVIEQKSFYMSQRCSNCGLVRKANRKGKEYNCKNCNFICDADLNAAKNHELNLPKIPFAFLSQKLNLGKGFFWKESGFYDFDGQEFRVSVSN